jgi:hypothetical protein
MSVMDPRGLSTLVETGPGAAHMERPKSAGLLTTNITPVEHRTGGHARRLGLLPIRRRCAPRPCAEESQNATTYIETEGQGRRICRTVS